MAKLTRVKVSAGVDEHFEVPNVVELDLQIACGPSESMPIVSMFLLIG